MKESNPYPLPEDSDWVRTEFPEEARERERKRRPILLGGMFGTQMLFYRPEDLWEEKDPNP